MPATGAYRVYGSALLAIHPWFRSPLAVGTFETRRTEIALTGFPPANQLPLQWAIDGTPSAAADVLTLRRGQRLRAQSVTHQTFAVMIVPATTRQLFQQPAEGVTLDGVASPVTHVPFR